MCIICIPMPHMRSCCCSKLDLRQGSIASGIYTVILALILLILVVLVVVLPPGVDHTYPDFYVRTFAIWMYISIAVFALWVIAGILLIIGASMVKRGMLYPWVIVTLIIQLIWILAIIDSFWKIAYVFEHVVFAVSFCLSIIFLIITVYAYICVSSFCSEIESGQWSRHGRRHHDGTGYGMSSPAQSQPAYVVSQPQPMYDPGKGY